MSQNKKLVFCPPACAEPLLSQLREDMLKKRKLLVIAPTAYAASELESHLISGHGVYAVWERPVFTFVDFAKKVLGDLNRKSLSHSAQMLVLEKVARNMRFDYYQRVSGMMGFLGLVRDLIQELKSALIFPDSFYERIVKPLRDSGISAVAHDTSHLEEIGELINSYQQVATDLGGDDEDLILEASHLLNEKGRSQSIDKLVLFGFSDLSALQWSIFESAVKAFEPSEVIFVMPFAGEVVREIIEKSSSVEFKATRDTIKKLKKLGFSELEFKGEQTAFNLLANAVLASSFSGEIDADVEMLEFFDEQDEIDGILKKWNLEAKAFGSDQTLILHRQSQKFSASFWEAIWHNSERLNDHFVPQFSQNIAPALLVEFMKALSEGDVSTLFATVKHIESPNKLHNLWREEASLIWKGGSLDIYELSLRLSISEELKEFIESSKGSKKPENWLNITRDFACKVLASRLFAHSPSQLGILNAFISELSDLNDKGLFGDEEISFGEWSKNCIKTLELMQTTSSKMLFNPVRSPFEIRGGSVNCAIICGLNLGEFPNQPRECVFLNDKMRCFLSSKYNLKLRTSEEIYREEWPLFYQVVSATKKKLILTRYKYVKHDAKVIPSPFWEIVTNIMKKEISPAGSTIKIEKSPAQRAFSKMEYVQLGDRARGIIIFWFTAGGEARPTQLESPSAYKSFASVSSMDYLVMCPYLFFASSLLELSSREDETIEAAWKSKRGTIVHRAFEYMLQNPAEWNLDALQNLLIQFAKEELSCELTLEQIEEFNIWAKKLQVAYSRYQEFKSSVLLSASYPLIERKSVIVFDLSEDAKLKLLGKLDLIEQLGEDFLIIDFKTSSNASVREMLKAIDLNKSSSSSYKKSVQLPLYSQADDFKDRRILAIAVLALRVPALYLFAEKEFADKLRRIIENSRDLKDFVFVFKDIENLKQFLREFLDKTLQNKLKELVLSGNIKRDSSNKNYCSTCKVQDFCRKPLR